MMTAKSGIEHVLPERDRGVGSKL